VGAALMLAALAGAVAALGGCGGASPSGASTAARHAPPITASEAWQHPDASGVQYYDRGALP